MRPRYNAARGAISTEYTVILVLVAVGIIIAFMLLGTTLRQQAGTSVDKIGGREDSYAVANRVDAAVDRMRAAEVNMSQGEGANQGSVGSPGEAGGGGGGHDGLGEGGGSGEGDDLAPPGGSQPDVTGIIDTGGTPPPVDPPGQGTLTVTVNVISYRTWRAWWWTRSQFPSG